MFPTDQVKRILAGATGIDAPRILLTSASGEKSFYSGNLSAAELSDAARYTGTRPVGGFLGQAAPYILLGQQIGLSFILPGVGTAILSNVLNAYEARRNNMALNIGAILGAAGQAFGSMGNPYGTAIGSVANVASAFFQPTAPAPQVIQAPPAYLPMPTSSQMSYAPPAIEVSTKNLPATSGSRGMTQDIFNAASKMLSRLGIAPKSVNSFFSVTRKAMSSLATLARRTPSGTLISLLVGLGLAAQEANQLAGWWATTGKKRRRINPANIHALRRSIRRVEGFERLASRVRRGEGKICKSRRRRPAPVCHK